MLGTSAPVQVTGDRVAGCWRAPDLADDWHVPATSRPMPGGRTARSLISALWLFAHRSRSSTSPMDGSQTRQPVLRRAGPAGRPGRHRALRDLRLRRGDGLRGVPVRGRQRAWAHLREHRLVAHRRRLCRARPLPAGGGRERGPAAARRHALAGHAPQPAGLRGVRRRRGRPRRGRPGPARVAGAGEPWVLAGRGVRRAAGRDPPGRRLRRGRVPRRQDRAGLHRPPGRRRRAGVGGHPGGRGPRCSRASAPCVAGSRSGPRSASPSPRSCWRPSPAGWGSRAPRPTLRSSCPAPPTCSGSSSGCSCPRWWPRSWSRGSPAGVPHRGPGGSAGARHRRRC